MTASQYLERQQAHTKSEHVFRDQVSTFLLQHAELLKGLSPETLMVFYKNLVHDLYFTVPYYADKQVFYEKLSTKLTTFVTNTNKLIEVITASNRDNTNIFQ